MVHAAPVHVILAVGWAVEAFKKQTNKKNVFT